MPEYTGPPDHWYDPPERPEFEKKECRGCGIETEINVESNYCNDCLEGMADAAAEAKVDQARDEGRI